MKKLALSLTVILVVANAYTKLEIKPGWQNLGTADNINVSEVFNRNSISLVYYYNENTKNWEVYSPNTTLENEIINKKQFAKSSVIPAFKGFWVYGKSYDTIIIDGNTTTMPPTLIGNTQIGGPNTSNGSITNNTVTSTTLQTNYNLTQEDKDALAYMWNEEKLAKDIYMTLYNLYSDNPYSKVLYNISTRSESTHQGMVEYLAQKYDLNITNPPTYAEHYDENELEKYGVGEFFVNEIQNLYNTLYEKGSQSMQDALEVGCMVEVTDVDDLNERIAEANASGALDLVTVFENLRQGSYNHYWAFDRALKNMGVSEGCCVLGDEYCKTPEEYPTK